MTIHRLQKLFAVIFAVIILCFGQNSFAQTLPNRTFEIDPLFPLDNPDAVLSLGKAPLIIESCKQYTGFFNKIVKCVSGMATRDDIYRKLSALSQKFAGVTNAALIMYIMLFGLRLSMNVIENVKSEIMVTLLMCFFVTYVNNAYRLDTLIKFFVGFQNEFANVAIIGALPADGTNSMVCYGDSSDPRSKYTLWQRVDCVFAYIIGMHPLVEKMGQIHSYAGEGDFTQDPTSALSNPGEQNNNAKISVTPLDTGTGTNYANLAEDPYCFFKWGVDLSVNNLNGLAVNAANGAVDSCYTKLYDYLQSALSSPPDPQQLAKAFRPAKTDKVQAFAALTLIVITVGTFLSDPSIGIFIVLTGFFILALMFAAFGQALMVYITSLFAIMVLGLFAPLMIPCVLFKQTRGMFESWLQMMFAYSLQPGIVLCYLSFMVFVLQYVVGHGSSVSNGARKSLKDFHFDLFDKGSVEFTDKLKTINKNSSQNDANQYGINILQSLNTATYMPDTDEFAWSLMNRPDDSFQTVATQNTQETRQGLFDFGFKTPNSGTDIKSFTLPTFSFTKVANAAMNLAINYDQSNANLAGSNLNAQQNKVIFPYLPTDPTKVVCYNQEVTYNPTTGDLTLETSLGTITCANGDPVTLIPMKPITLTNYVSSPDTSLLPPFRMAANDLAKSDKTEFQLKYAYMQALLVVFIILCITFAFMKNVMVFAGAITGASTPAIGKMANLYELTSGKLMSALRT